MELVLETFSLIESITLGDGSVVTSDTILGKISGPEDNMLYLETMDDGDVKRYFWAKENNLSPKGMATFFLEEQEFNNRIKDLNENWFE